MTSFLGEIILDLVVFEKGDIVMLISGASYPLLDAFLTILWVVGFILWISLAIFVFADIFRSRDLSGWGKAGWIVAVIIFPLLGVLFYLVVRGSKIHQHAEEEATAADLQTREYIRNIMASNDPTEEITKLSSLHDSGVLSDDEFERMKARIPEQTRRKSA